MKTDLTNLSYDTKKALSDLIVFAVPLTIMWSTGNSLSPIIGFLVSIVVAALYGAIFGKIFQLRPAHMIYGIVFAGGMTIFLPLMWFLQGSWETNPNLPGLPASLFIVLSTVLYLIAVTATQILSDSATEKKKSKILTAVAVSAVYAIAVGITLSFENEAYVFFLKETAAYTALIVSGMGVVYALLYRKIPGPKALGFLPISIIAVLLTVLVGWAFLTNGPTGDITLPADSWLYYSASLIAAGVYVALIRAVGKAIQKKTNTEKCETNDKNVNKTVNRISGEQE